MKIWGVRGEFLKRQLTTLVGFVSLCAVYHVMGACRLIAEGEVGEYIEDECLAVQALNQIEGDLKQGNPNSIRIDRGPGNLPNSRITFQTRGGTRVSYYELNHALYSEKDGDSHKIHDNVVSILFFPPSLPNLSYLAEIQIRVEDFSGNYSQVVPFLKRINI